MNLFVMRMIFGLELKSNLMSPNMMVHFVLLLPLVLVKLTVGVSTPGVPGPTSKLSLRVPAQMGRRETKHKGENSKGKPRPRVVLRLGRMRLQ
jgi:hypothetical protein